MLGFIRGWYTWNHVMEILLELPIHHVMGNHVRQDPAVKGNFKNVSVVLYPNIIHILDLVHYSILLGTINGHI